MWAHAYGGVNEDKVWSLVVFEESEISPNGKTLTGIPVKELTIPHGMGNGELTYLTSWDHTPSEAEKQEITPRIYL